uniref:Sema domain-containing protein n=1 Tax=Mola mola TaxID=94237 RepID=A0A3Q4AW81_MOLML
MGLRAALLLTELLLLTASRILLAGSLLEDSVPLNVADAHFSQRYPVFRPLPSGSESHNLLDFQLMTKINDTLFIAGRDQVYLVSLRESLGNEIIPYQKLTWKSGQADREMCTLKGKQGDECHNFIKVLVPRNDDLVFICGTNSFNPKCRTYRLANLTFNGEEINGMGRCPFDFKQTNIALFAGKPRPRLVGLAEEQSLLFHHHLYVFATVRLGPAAKINPRNKEKRKLQ